MRKYMETIIALWQRDMILLWRDKSKIFSTFAMPFFILYILGGGIGASMSQLSQETEGLFSEITYTQYIYPGMIAVTILTVSLYSALSIVEDKERGYLKEVLVSPAKKAHVVLGNICGSTCVSFFQGAMLLIFIPFLNIKINVTDILLLLAGIFLVSFTLSSLGILVASNAKSASGYHAIEQFMMYPMLFLSGALYSTDALPNYIGFLVRINPVSYAVDMFKKLILWSSLSGQARGELGLTLFGHQIALRNEFIILFVLGVIFVALTTRFMNRKR